MKQLSLFIFSLFLLFSCYDKEIYSEYQMVNYNWQLVATNNMEFTDSLLSQLNIGENHFKKKYTNPFKSKGMGYEVKMVDANNSNFYLSFSLHENKIFRISDVTDWDNFKDTTNNSAPISKIGKYNPSEVELKLENELVGSWNYFVDEKNLELTLGDKKMVFKRAN